MASKNSKKKSKKNKNHEERPEKRSLIERYDANGNRIGDDGYVMTKVRTHMHRLLNGYFVWGIIAAVIAIVLLVLSYFQGAQFTDWELVQRGGNQFHGWDTAMLMRFESIFLLYTAVFSVILNVFGFRWFYDNSSEKRFANSLYIYAAIAVVYFVAALVLVSAPEPVSVIDVLFVVLAMQGMRAVKCERPKLKKARVAKTVTKK